MSELTGEQVEELRRLEADIQADEVDGLNAIHVGRVLLVALVAARTERDAARAEAARERRGREVAEARAAYWKADRDRLHWTRESVLCEQEGQTVDERACADRVVEAINARAGAASRLSALGAEVGR
jgi:hypothetical protein